MTELMQQIVELEQQQIMCLSGGMIALLIGLVGLVVGILINTLCFQSVREKITNGIIITMSVGLLITATILIIKGQLLIPQIEMLKCQIDGVIPVLPMN